MIEIKALTKYFGPFAAVAGIDFTVAKGEVLGFLGPNGAGKSTTMKMITGFLAPTSGEVRICGVDAVRTPRQAQALIGYLPEGAPAYPDMTPLQFLRFIADIRGLTGAARKAAISHAIAQTDLESALEQPIETLSKGFKRRVGLAQAIIHDPPVLIMDEPTDGLDPNQKHAVRRLISEMAAEKAIIISTHILEEVEAVCTRALIIDRGRIVADGTPASLAARSRYHDAVTITVDRTLAPEITRELKARPEIAGTEEHNVSETLVAITAFPIAGKRLVETISAWVSSKNLNVRGLYAEPGRLDEVFRNLTTADAVHVTEAQ